ncbi:nucleotidyltransferase family protein [Roseateles sp. So40a]|uniref:nucleotidyltransferase family protein n=1 Tax=Roseateles sp. So40a TaxID=3400226 RepID=UPI003A8584CA
MKPSEALALKRDELGAVVARYPMKNLRLFGSALHGQDREDSDLDLLVDPLPGTTLIDLGGLQRELEVLLGVPVHLLTPGFISEKFRAQVLAEARPV